MARTPKDYWEQRSTELMKRLEKGTEKTINALVESYEQATKNINKKITNIYKNFAKDTGLSKETLTQLLNKKETDEHYKNLLQVIDNNITSDDIKKKLLAKYNAPAYSYRISRYQVLQENIDIELKKLADIEQKITEIRYVDTIKEGYYHNIYDIQKGTGLGFSFAQIDDKTINLLLNENWTNGENFSQRIWNNSEKLGNYLKTQLTADTMSGKPIPKMASELSEYMNVGLYMATTLVRTEVNHFANESEMLAYEELSIDKYRFIATLDKITCEHCAELDNKVFNVKDRKPGKNYPPIHPNDRCTTVAEFDNEVTEGLQRRARDENKKSILVDQNMDYKQWYEQSVTNVNKNDIINNTRIKEDIQNTLLDIYEARRKKYGLNLMPREDFDEDDINNNFPVKLNRIDENISITISENLKELGQEYYSTLTRVELADKQYILLKPNVNAYVDTQGKVLQTSMKFNPIKLKNYTDHQDLIAGACEVNYLPKISTSNYKNYVTTHEFAHTIYNSNMLGKNYINMDESIYKNFDKELREFYESYKVKISNIKKQKESLNNKLLFGDFKENDKALLKSLNAEYKDTYISQYASKGNSADEFMAECFTEAKLSDNPSKTSKEVLGLIDKYFKR